MPSIYHILTNQWRPMEHTKGSLIRLSGPLGMYIGSIGGTLAVRVEGAEDGVGY